MCAESNRRCDRVASTLGAYAENQTGAVTESGVYTGGVRKALLERGHFTSRLKEKSTFVLYLIYAHYGVIIKVF